MPDALPGPFEEWPMVDQLAWLAEEMTLAGSDAEAIPAYMAAEWGAHLAEIADDPSWNVTTTTLAQGALPCGQPGKGTQKRELCDRPAEHRGEHSWEAGRYRRMVADYELHAARASGLQTQLTRERTRAKVLEGKLGALAEVASSRAKRRAAKAEAQRERRG